MTQEKLQEKGIILLKIYEIQNRKNYLQPYVAVNFVDENAKKIEKEQVKPHEGFKWLNDEWYHFGSDSWEYSTNLSFDKNNSWSHHDTLLCFYRRRAWYRKTFKYGITEEDKKSTFFLKKIIF